MTQMADFSTKWYTVLWNDFIDELYVYTLFLIAISVRNHPEKFMTDCWP